MYFPIRSGWVGRLLVHVSLLMDFRSLLVFFLQYLEAMPRRYTTRSLTVSLQSGDMQ